MVLGLTKVEVYSRKRGFSIRFDVLRRSMAYEVPNQAVVGSIVRAFLRLKKPRDHRERSARGYALHSVCSHLFFMANAPWRRRIVIKVPWRSSIAMHDTQSRARFSTFAVPLARISINIAGSTLSLTPQPTRIAAPAGDVLPNV